MISILNRGMIHMVDNKDTEVCYCTGSERKEIEELTGKDIEKLSSKEIRELVRFINVE